MRLLAPEFLLEAAEERVRHRAAAPALAGWQGPEPSTFGFNTVYMAFWSRLRAVFLFSSEMKALSHLQA